MKKIVVIWFALLSVQLFAQGPGQPLNPMTAPGAKSITPTNHILIWKNPIGVKFNQLYFSTDSILILNLDPAVIVFDGNPSNSISEFNLNNLGGLLYYKKYYWRIVEFDSTGSTIGPIWYFKTLSLPTSINFSFDDNMNNWEIFGPLGINNWYWSNSSHTSSLPGEVIFRWDPIFNGESYIVSPEITSPIGISTDISFNYFEDWWSDTVIVGCAITTDNGNSWSTIWDLHATSNVGPNLDHIFLEASENFRLGFFYSGNSNNIDFFYIDDISIESQLITFITPTFLKASTSDTIKRVTLEWSMVQQAPIFPAGYELQRKNGSALSTDQYATIDSLDVITPTYLDYGVELNQTYTYRIRTFSMGSYSYFGNEATAYIPAIVPVELVSFNSSVTDNNVILNWQTATETNNQGFQIERRKTQDERSEKWENIGFINGFGTTTEPQSYSFVDENLLAGNYQYRLKQFDFDGTFEYSNAIEVEINSPTKFSLEQNYPNPFNPSTNIQYAISSTQLVTLKVFDVLGKEVATLVNEEKPAGIYKVEFKSSVGSLQLASGIYYYQLRVADYIETKKMILMK